MTLNREALLVYVAHIVVLYRLPLGSASLSRIYSKSLSAWEYAALTFGLILLMWAMARGWGWMRSRYKQGSRYLAYATGAVGLFLMQ